MYILDIVASLLLEHHPSCIKGIRHTYHLVVGPCKSDRKKFGPISVRFFFSSGEYLIAKSSTRLDLYNRRSEFSVRFSVFGPVYFFFGPIYLQGPRHTSLMKLQWGGVGGA